MNRWTIIADDLTGAADAAASFAPFCATSVHVDSESAWPDQHQLALVGIEPFQTSHQARQLHQAVAGAFALAALSFVL